jgi:hypothetical protein
MNAQLRERAKINKQPLMDYILRRIKEIEKETGTRRTIFAACPNSMAVIRAALRSAKRNNSPVKFAATLNQVDIDGGYTPSYPARIYWNNTKRSQDHPFYRACNSCSRSWRTLVKGYS